MSKIELNELKKVLSSSIDHSNKLKRVASLLNQITQNNHPGIDHKCLQIIRRGLAQDTDSFGKYCADTIVKSADAPATAHDGSLILLSFLLRSSPGLGLAGTDGSLSDHSGPPAPLRQGALGDLFNKLVIEARSRLSPNVVESTKHILRIIPITEIRNAILPTLRKAMLRNPEITIFNAQYLFVQLLTGCEAREDIAGTMDLLIPHLVSGSNEGLANQALRTFEVFASASPTLSSRTLNNARAMVEDLTNAYKGQLCKQTVPKLKATILEAIRALSSLPELSTTDPAPIADILSRLRDLIGYETHETLLLYAHEAFRAWLGAARTSLDPGTERAVLTFVQDGLSFKSKSSQACRTKYLESLHTLLNGWTEDLDGSLQTFLPNLAKCSEANNSTYQQTLIDNAVLYVVLKGKTDATKADLSHVKSALKSGAICLRREKIFSPIPASASAPPEAGQLLTFLAHVDMAFQLYPTYVRTEDLRLYTKVLIVITCTSPDHVVRKEGLAILRRCIIRTQEQACCSLPYLLMEDLGEFLRSYDNQSSKMDDNKIVVNYITHCLRAICFPCPDFAKHLSTRDKDQLLFQTLLTTSHPAVCNLKHPFFPSLLRQYKVGPTEFVTKNIQAIIKEIFSPDPDSTTNDRSYSDTWLSNLIQILVDLSPKGTLSKLSTHVLDRMKHFDSEGKRPTVEGVSIYRTPLYSIRNRKLYTGIIESLQATKLPIKPLNKLSSIKDGAEREEMRKNLEEYNQLLELEKIFLPQDGTNVAGIKTISSRLDRYLDHKQKAALFDEYLKEQKIRTGLEKDLRDFKFYAKILNAIYRTKSPALASFVDESMSLFIDHLGTNPLTAPTVTDLLYELARFVSPDKHKFLGPKIATMIVEATRCNDQLIVEAEPDGIDNDVWVPIVNELSEIFVGRRNQPISSTATEPSSELRSAFLDLSHFLFVNDRYHFVENDTNDVGLIEKYLDVISVHLDPRGNVIRPNAPETAVIPTLGNDVQAPKASYEYKARAYPRLRVMQMLFKVVDLNFDNLTNLSLSILKKLIRYNETHAILDSKKTTVQELSLILERSLSHVPKVREICLALLVSYKDCLSIHLQNNYGHSLKNGPCGTGESLATAGGTVWQNLFCALWVEKFDAHEPCRAMASKLWDQCKLKHPPSFVPSLVEYSVRTPEYMHQWCGEALAEYLITNPDQLESCLNKLIAIYEDRHKPLPPQHDAFGRSLGIKVNDDYNARRCIATALTCVMTRTASTIQNDNEARTRDAYAFVVGHGLGDRDSMTRDLMLKAALAMVHRVNESDQVDMANEFIDMADRKLLEAPLSAQYDDMRQGLVILLGHLAKNIRPGDPRLGSIFTKLVTALSTPSQSVQESVANCLAILAPSLEPERVSVQHDAFWAIVFDEKAKFAVRKGAAYGLAGILKGFGLAGLKKFDSLNRLNEALAEKKNARKKEGALFVLESLTRTYGKLMEPYSINFMPTLLTCFGDGLSYVREGAQDAFKAITSGLTSHGINLMIPILTEALSNDAWRTQIASIEMLGSMSHCAPDQLSSCLPTIVPKLVETLSNSHDKVRNSGALALRSIGSVMQNPEIRDKVDILIDTMRDPDAKSASCLKTLLGTRLFVHTIDTASLALLMPVVQRTMQDRSSEIRRMALQVLADMFNLTGESDVKPYLKSLLPRMKICLVDPLPEVRNQASHALGNLVAVVDKTLVEELVSWLMKTLVSEISSVDRSGAAQGLSMMVRKLGISRLDSILADVIHTLNTPNLPSPVKDGYLMMLHYLPSVFENEFIPYLNRIVPSLLLGLADESEYVRETAIKAGKRIITMYSVATMSDFLPEIERGLLVPNWRIRYSSVQLIGELLFSILGVTGKMTTVSEEDETFASEAATEILSQTLGVERQNKILSGLYICSCDTQDDVASASLHIWKIVVHNTARMLKQILTQLIPFILQHISSTHADLITIAGRSIGQVVRKLEGVLPEFLSILRKKFDASYSPESANDILAYEIRRGVCVAIREILNNTSRDMITMYGDAIDHTLSLALCDEEESVRVAAVQALDKYHQVCGQKIFETMIPQLLNKMEREENNSGILEGMKELVELKSRAILPYIIPKLGSNYVKCAHVYELLAFCSEGTLDKYADQVLPRMLCALDTMIRDGQVDVELYLCDALEEDDKSDQDDGSESGSEASDTGEKKESLVDDGDEHTEATDSIREILGLFETADSLSHLFDNVIFPALKSLDPNFAYQTPLESEESDDLPVPSANSECLSGLLMLHMYLTTDDLDTSHRLPCVKAVAPMLKSHDTRVVQLACQILDMIFKVLEPAAKPMPRNYTTKSDKPTEDSDDSDDSGQDDSDTEERDSNEAIREILVALKNFFRTVGSGSGFQHHSETKDPNNLCLAGLHTFPPAINPLLSLTVEKGLLNPEFAVKDQAAQAVLELVKVCPATTLKPVILKFMGPVLRLLTQRYNPPFRSILLQICGALLYKNNSSLKAFVPQLQATFFKALKDADYNVRLNAARGLAHLMPVHPRALNVYNELVITNTTPTDDSDKSRNGYGPDGDVQEKDYTYETAEYREISMKKTTLYALRLAIPQTPVLDSALAQTVLDKLISMADKSAALSEDGFSEESPSELSGWVGDDDNKRIVMGCIGALCQHLTAPQFRKLLRERVLIQPHPKDVSDDVGFHVTTYVICKKCPSMIAGLIDRDPELWTKLVDTLDRYLAPDGEISSALSAIKTLTYMVSHYLTLPTVTDGTDIPSAITNLYVKAVAHKAHDVKMLCINTIHYLYETCPALCPTLTLDVSSAGVKSFTRTALQILQKGCNDGNSVVRNQSENILARLLGLDSSATGNSTYLELLGTYLGGSYGNSGDQSKNLLDELRVLVEKTLIKKIQNKKSTQIKMTLKPTSGLLLEQDQLDDTILS